jgi:hypothetical protein
MLGLILGISGLSTLVWQICCPFVKNGIDMGYLQVQNNIRDMKNP